ncbi:PEPxxWA-CTERM sorting domain-containing protein [Novosphingobium sp. ES2-1]|uniref:PEPxxWA-CTERM sorting domain-containing protein n=1 Tax=Novosphingobium sp. ES2-1 TaxID=2780074 RepID=UPI001E4F2688|nr:PEPxxWA-CTERM sorting domain-containing protein [Novosphingobium sp. ES2-1]
MRFKALLAGAVLCFGSGPSWAAEKIVSFDNGPGYFITHPLGTLVWREQFLGFENFAYTTAPSYGADIERKSLNVSNGAVFLDAQQSLAVGSSRRHGYNSITFSSTAPLLIFGQNMFGPSLTILADAEPGYQTALITNSGGTYASRVFSADGSAFSISSVSFSVVPEPATWALMILGIGLAGAALRRRRANPIVV